MKRLLLLPILAPSLAFAQDVTGRASVIDGDTLEIHGKRIRLHGIDAPESGQSCRTRDGKRWRCGQKAALALSDKIGPRTVSCTRKSTDRYKRIVAKCTVSGEDLGEWLVTNGWAVAYYQYSYEYSRAEQGAKSARRGVWKGEFVKPWDWRRAKRMKAEEKAKRTGCRIKGNISRRGTRIYHLPGGKFYDRTRIDTSKGELWFCTEAEAHAAGWRRSKQ